MARHLMARNERQIGQRGPVALDGMEVAVTDAAGRNLDENLAMAGLRDGNILDA